jgi:TonB family protein
MLFILSCNPRNKMIAKVDTSKNINRTLPKTLYYIDSNGDGIYELIEIEEDKKPKPIQGERQFNIDFYTALRYPASAREQGIQGIVLLDIDVDEKGNVSKVATKKGISKDCDLAAENAFVAAAKNGYWPLIIENKPTKFKMDVPVGFWIEN